MKDKKIGFIGLGNVGSKIAYNILKDKKFSLYVFDLNKTNLQKMEKLGADVSDSLKKISDNQVIFLCLPTSQDVEKIVIGNNSLSKYLKPNSFIIDMTTGEPAISRKIQKELSRA